MALPLNPTFGQIRNEVLLRCGYSTEGNQAAGVIPVCDSYIAGAEKQLFLESEWLKGEMRITVELTEDINVVDWPDEAALGEIVSVAVVKENDDGTESRFPMDSGARLQERDVATESGQPKVYEYKDENIYVYPPPTEDYVSLEIDYRLRPSLVNSNDRTVVDGELLTQLATFQMKEYLGLPIGPVELRNHDRYMARVRAQNSQRSGIQLGGHRARSTYPRLKNRIVDGTRPNSGFDNYNPW